MPALSLVCFKVAQNYSYVVSTTLQLTLQLLANKGKCNRKMELRKHNDNRVVITT